MTRADLPPDFDDDEVTRVVALARHLLRGTGLAAEDVVGEALAIAARSAPPAGARGPWLRGIVRGVIRTRLGDGPRRPRQRNPPRPDPDDEADDGCD